LNGAVQFVVSFPQIGPPLSAEKGKEVRQMDQSHGSPNYEKTILVVDDDEVILKFISELLGDGRYNVLAASSGVDALQQSRDCCGEIHLLLSDFQMPGMSGIELATQMSVEQPQLKVLMMSGLTGGMLALKEGWHFLHKPFIPSQLSALVSGLLFPDKSSRLSGVGPLLVPFTLSN
jgi:CheY-like chemotaxis protein